MKRVACYIDGFNVYHAIDDLSRAQRGALNHLKWLDLRRLMGIFIDPAVHSIVSIKYFSAYATWKPVQHKRHELYVAALEARGIEVVLGQFKEKNVYCPSCQSTFMAHEEKESDVNLACHLIHDAYQNTFDHGFIVTRDSDLSAPIRFVRKHFPAKKIKIIAPPQRGHSKELWALAHNRASISADHLASCLFPRVVMNRASEIVCTRPAVYDPPK
jgi:uncharacterized LabA/DUF88 family protein